MGLLAAAPLLATAAVSQIEAERIDAFLANYYKNVIITKRAMNAAKELISCVDVYHQPAQNNPLAGIREIQLEPSPQLKALLGGQVSSPPPSKICPPGSVEMRLPTREQIIAQGSLEKFLSKSPTSDGKRGAAPPPVTSGSWLYDGHYWATVNADVNALAAQSTINLWRPAVQQVPVPENYYLLSLSQIWVNGGGFTGGTGALQSVEAGATVYQSIYRDMDTHFFIYWTADEYFLTGCQDLNCPAFVVTDAGSLLPIGGKLAPSTMGGEQHEGTIAWYRDPATFNWLLFLYDSVNGYRQIGYYPVGLFAGGQLSRNATRVSFGGEVYTPPADAPTVPMGSGNNPNNLGSVYGQVAYQRNLKWMDLAGVVQDYYFTWARLEPAANGCAYGGAWHPASAPYQPGWGSAIFFGGSGYGGSCVRP